MSKQIKPALIALFLILGLFSSLLVTSTGSAQQAARQKTAETSRTARNAALIAATSAVLKETSEIRQLPILRPVQSSTQSRAEIERMITKNLDEDTTPADLHADEVTLKKLGLAAADFEYRPFLIRLLTEQVAGYYEPKARAFYLADWIDLDGQKPIMAHELTHALQDQHFDLRRFEHWPKGDSDAELASHALIEGDATLAMMLYVASDPMRALSFLKSLGATGMASEELEKAPRALREGLLFPYQEGTDWSRHLYKDGGWARVSRAYTELPQSTEQILHPDKYFAREAPVKMTLPNLTGVLNGSGTSASGQWAVGGGQKNSELRTQHSALSWKKIDRDVNGEFGFYLILDQFLKSPAESRRAAAGWGGDIYDVYEGSQGEALIACSSSWDTERDAREFFDAYAKRTSLRYPGVSRINIPAEKQEGLESQWRTPEGVVILRQRGSNVLIVEGLPEFVSMRVLFSVLR